MYVERERERGREIQRSPLSLTPPPRRDGCDGSGAAARGDDAPAPDV